MEKFLEKHQLALTPTELVDRKLATYMDYLQKSPLVIH